MKNSLLQLLLWIPAFVFSQTTTFDDLKLIIAQEAIIVEEQENMVQYTIGELPLYLIVDEEANRMRMMSPIIEVKELNHADFETLMEANFDRALDAKYATSNGILWSVYAHPLKELYKEQVLDALNQVRWLVYNYGTSYSSTTMVFGGGDN